MVDAMNPIIFESNATMFQTNGIGALLDVTECHVIEALNGAFELQMNVRKSDKYFEHIKVENIVVVKPNLTDSRQAFVIESVEKDVDGNANVYAVHIAQHRAKLIPVRQFTASSLADAIANVQTLELNPFTLTTDKTSSSTYKIETPRSYREFLGGRRGSLLDVYGGEYKWNNFVINLLQRRGKETNVRILYGLNMTELNLDDEFSFDESITGILPFWYSEEENRLVTGTIQYSSNADSFSYKKTIPVDMTNDFEDVPTANQLNTKARSLLMSRGKISRTIEVSFEQIQQMQFGDFKDNSQSLQLGDTVTVMYSEYGLNYQSRIVEIDFDVLLERYNKMTIGAKRSSVTDSISQLTESIIDDFNVVASDVKYNDAVSQLEVETVQGAIDKLKSLFANIGQTMQAYLSTAKSVEPNTATELVAMTLPPGTWILNAKTSMNSGSVSDTSTQFRVVALGTSVGGSQVAGIEVPPVKQGNTMISLAGRYVVSEETTFYLSLNHNATGNVNVVAGANTTFIRATRIK